MTNIFDKFNKEIDMEALQRDIEEASNGSGGDFEEVPKGEYEVKVEKMELILNKKGNPMLSVWFKIVNDCKYKNSLIFLNQVMLQGFQIHIVNELLRSLVEEVDNAPDIKFNNDYNLYADMVLDIFELINNNYEYALDYGENKKGYPTYKILETYILED